jgi:AcrR family transcriptional regulator
MNEKFFDLKKEKQDRMINAALKYFGENGYKRASTDDMVREAGISKGLLFHYFGCKSGLYFFVCDYSVRYLILELTRVVSIKETDYFEIIKQVELGKMQILKTYPYLTSFIKGVQLEKDQEAIEAAYEIKTKYEDYMDNIFRRIKEVKYKTGVDNEKLHNIVEFTLDGIYQEFLKQGCENPEIFYGTVVEYLDMIKKMSEK